jgi:hypothetical protein
MKPIDYTDTLPRFCPEEYFAGRGRATGIIQFRSSHPRRAFTLDIEGTWDGVALGLAEEFRFDDGEVLNRGWSFKKVDEHRYEGTADDIVGIAVAEAYGQAFYITYDLALTTGGRRIVVHFKDWSWLQPNGVLINVAKMYKFGLQVGGLTAFFEKPDWNESNPVGR